jgi:predicted outer membrane protein
MSTAYGPLTAADRDFVRKVRLAGLWELPAGRQAQQRGTRPAVRTAGEHLVEGHTELDRQVIQVGQALGIDLPNQPSEQQQEWLGQLTRARGDDYERLFIQLLRRAHGKVFALLAGVRAQTRNSMVRALATSANATVLDHISVLEDSGLVDFDALSDNVRPTK